MMLIGTLGATSYKDEKKEIDAKVVGVLLAELLLIFGFVSHFYTYITGWKENKVYSIIGIAGFIMIITGIFLV